MQYSQNRQALSNIEHQKALNYDEYAGYYMKMRTHNSPKPGERLAPECQQHLEEFAGSSKNLAWINTDFPKAHTEGFEILVYLIYCNLN